MKKFTIMLAVLLITLGVKAQKASPVLNYDVVVAFGSICCGTASDSFLHIYVKEFSSRHKVKISACKSSGCGKEGEYNIMFCLANLKADTKKQFLSELENMIELEDRKNKANSSSSGSINMEFNKANADFSFCRGGIEKWN